MIDSLMFVSTKIFNSNYIEDIIHWFIIYSFIRHWRFRDSQNNTSARVNILKWLSS